MVVEKDDRLILLTNDDGLYASGLRTLLDVIEEFGKVVLVSTVESMSGMSQALTVKTPLRVKLLEETDRRKVFACNGTPTDSIKLAVNQLVDKKPDWVVSGINHGANASVSVLYSGSSRRRSSRPHPRPPLPRCPRRRPPSLLRLQP